MCGTPRCSKPDFHIGPCDTVGPLARKRSAPIDRWCPTDNDGRSNKQEPQSSTKAPKTKATSIPVDSEHQVGSLLAVRTKAGRREFVVRWLGRSPKEDTWESAARIESSLIAAFDRSPLLRAPWKGRGHSDDAHSLNRFLLLIF